MAQRGNRAGAGGEGLGITGHVAASHGRNWPGGSCMLVQLTSVSLVLQRAQVSFQNWCPHRGVHGRCRWPRGSEMSMQSACAQGAFLKIHLLPIAVHQAQLLSSTRMYKEGTEAGGFLQPGERKLRGNQVQVFHCPEGVIEKTGTNSSQGGAEKG